MARLILDIDHLPSDRCHYQCEPRRTHKDHNGDGSVLGEKDHRKRASDHEWTEGNTTSAGRAARRKAADP